MLRFVPVDDFFSSYVDELTHRSKRQGELAGGGRVGRERREVRLVGGGWKWCGFWGGAGAGGGGDMRLHVGVSACAEAGPPAPTPCSVLPVHWHTLGCQHRLASSDERSAPPPAALAPEDAKHARGAPSAGQLPGAPGGLSQQQLLGLSAGGLLPLGGGLAGPGAATAAAAAAQQQQHLVLPVAPGVGLLPGALPLASMLPAQQPGVPPEAAAAAVAGWQLAAQSSGDMSAGNTGGGGANGGSMAAVDGGPKRKTSKKKQESNKAAQQRYRQVQVGIFGFMHCATSPQSVAAARASAPGSQCVKLCAWMQTHGEGGRGPILAERRNERV